MVMKEFMTSRNKKLIVERGMDGEAIKLKAEVGVDGRPLEFREKS
jgi:hypothetical protein